MQSGPARITMLLHAGRIGYLFVIIRHMVGVYQNKFILMSYIGISWPLSLEPNNTCMQYVNYVKL